MSCMFISLGFDELNAIKMYADIKYHSDTDRRKETLKIIQYIREKMKENNQKKFDDIDATNYWIKDYIKNNPIKSV